MWFVFDAIVVLEGSRMIQSRGSKSQSSWTLVFHEPLHFVCICASNTHIEEESKQLYQILFRFIRHEGWKTIPLMQMSKLRLRDVMTTKHCRSSHSLVEDPGQEPTALQPRAPSPTLNLYYRPENMNMTHKLLQCLQKVNTLPLLIPPTVHKMQRCHFRPYILR